MTWRAHWPSAAGPPVQVNVLVDAVGAMAMPAEQSRLS